MERVLSGLHWLRIAEWQIHYERSTLRTARMNLLPKRGVIEGALAALALA